MIKYTCGFLFHGQNVLLVQKERPDWQRGVWNGIGGKVEQSETPEACMRREFREETRLDILDWDVFAIERGRCTETEFGDYMVYFYRAKMEGRVELQTVNDVGERLQWFHHHNVRGPSVIGNLNWLVPMARDWRRFVAQIETTDAIRTRPTW